MSSSYQSAASGVLQLKLCFFSHRLGDGFEVSTIIIWIKITAISLRLFGHQHFTDLTMLTFRWLFLRQTQINKLLYRRQISHYIVCTLLLADTIDVWRHIICDS